MLIFGTGLALFVLALVLMVVFLIADAVRWLVSLIMGG
jgi:hypothetical protein